MSADIRKMLTEEIAAFVAAEGKRCILKDLWQEPIVGFADVKHPYIRHLRETVHPLHQMPEDVLADATAVIAYFVPFNRWLTETNRGAELASPQWAQAYEETNAMFGRLNEYIIKTVHNMGYEAKTSPEAGVFYRDEVMSHWSFRHLAYAAGLGTFGLNNMLITDKGCGGRVNTVVTNLDVETDVPRETEACLFKRNGSCGACAARCPSKALTKTGFDREKCYEQCLKNAYIHTGYGNSYASEVGHQTEDSGSEVCGKCLVGLPCTHKAP